MKNRTQIFALLIITLITGFAIGYLVNGRVVSYRIDKMRTNYNETGFGREIMRVIQPTEEQKEKIIPLFKEFAGKNHELIGTYHDDQMELFYELKEDLRDILTSEQISRLDEHWKTRKKKFRKPRHRRQDNRNGAGRQNRR
jgi:hypothetical protein